MKTVNVIQQQFKDLLFYEIGSTMIAGRYMAPLSMLKTNNPYDGATQEYKFTAALNWVYERSVNKRLFKKYGPYHTNPFVSGPRSWGVHLMDGMRETVVVTHKGKFYMNCVLGTIGRKTFRFKGHIIPGMLVYPFMKNKPAFVKSQGLTYSESVKKQDFSFDNLKWVQIRGVRYNLI
jgi:hypothetical protein